MEQKIIAIDFDGTLFETDYPRIVRPILPVIELAKAEQEKGAKLILWTCREGRALDEAVKACLDQGLRFDAINDNLPEMKEKWGNNPRKVSADEYWDDKNSFCFPLENTSGYTWDATGKTLETRKLLSEICLKSHADAISYAGYYGKPGISTLLRR